MLLAVEPAALVRVSSVRRVGGEARGTGGTTTWMMRGAPR